MEKENSTKCKELKKMKEKMNYCLSKKLMNCYLDTEFEYYSLIESGQCPKEKKKKKTNSPPKRHL
ncbi:MAG: hypothetical protein LBD41_08190 [Clostridiales Family XIII bacterium]|jgi:hypothetical protein|nr:hypothetical protein [Clostridiales Family XIII bacterium]